MAAKHDLDNHSNQLNPNNDAYYSSRGISRDDGDEGLEKEGQARYIHPLPNTYRSEAIEFRAGVLSFSGKYQVLRFDVFTTFDSAFLGASNRIRLDMEDFAERIMTRLCGAFSAKWKDKIAFSALFNEKGEELAWITTEYNPKGYLGRTRENDRVWIETGQYAARAIRHQLSAQLPVLDDMGGFELGRSRILSEEHHAHIANFINTHS